MDKTKLLFLHQETTFFVHYIPLKYFTPSSKLVLSAYQTTILETEKFYWIIYKQKITFESWKPVFFQRFYFLMKPFV